MTCNRVSTEHKNISITRPLYNMFLTSTYIMLNIYLYIYIYMWTSHNVNIDDSNMRWVCGYPLHIHYIVTLVELVEEYYCSKRWLHTQYQNIITRWLCTQYNSTMTEI